MKPDCEHELAPILSLFDEGNYILIKTKCLDCGTVWEYAVSTSDLMEAVSKLDPDPLIFVNGRLQNE